MLKTPWVWIVGVVWLLATVAGIAILSLGIWRKGRWATWFDVLTLRWVLIVWFVFTAASYFVHMVLAMTYDEYAGVMYLRQPRAVDVALAEIAGYLARNAAWIVGLVILAFGLLALDPVSTMGRGSRPGLVVVQRSLGVGEICDPVA